MPTDDATPLSAAEIETIRERVPQATPGPWTASERYGNIDGPDGMEVVRGDVAACGVLDDADAHFIAAARTDVPRLLATLDAYREIVAAVAADTRARTVSGIYIIEYNCAWCSTMRKSQEFASRDEAHTADCPVTRARALLGEQA